MPIESVPSCPQLPYAPTVCIQLQRIHTLIGQRNFVFTARRFASATRCHRASLCVSVCVSVTPRHCIKTAKRIGSHKQRRTIAEGL